MGVFVPIEIDARSVPGLIEVGGRREFFAVCSIDRRRWCSPQVRGHSRNVPSIIFDHIHDQLMCGRLAFPDRADETDGRAMYIFKRLCCSFAIRRYYLAERLMERSGTGAGVGE